MRKILLISLGTLFSFVAHAEIYKYVDENGRVTYSNLPMKGAKKVDLPEISTIAPPKSQTNTVAPSTFPKVDTKTQRERDDVRRKILEDELRTEEQSLIEAQQALQEGQSVRMGNEKNYQKYLDRVQSLKDNVSLHEKNIAALRKELSGTR